MIDLHEGILEAFAEVSYLGSESFKGLTVQRDSRVETTIRVEAANDTGRKCVQCGVVFEVTRLTVQKKHCSEKCRFNTLYQKKKQRGYKRPPYTEEQRARITELQRIRRAA